MVERQLPKLNVAGSIPVSRSNKNYSLPARRRISPPVPGKHHELSQAEAHTDQCARADILDVFKA